MTDDQERGPVCVICAGHNRGRPAVDGLLCRSDAVRLRITLNSLLDNWTAAGDPSGSAADDGYGAREPTYGRSATRVYSPVPIDIGTIDRGARFRQDADRIDYWARAVASARKILPANFPRATRPQIELLLLHLPWIMAQPAAVEFEADVRRIRGRLAKVTGAAKLEGVGLCRQRTTRGRCDGELLRDGAGVVRCGRDPSHVDHVRPGRST